MKKLAVLLVAAACVCAGRAEDSYMWWMVDEFACLTLDGEAFPDGGDYSVKVSAFDASTGMWSSDFVNLSSVTADGSLQSIGSSVGLGADGTSFYSVFASGMTGDDWNYYIEVYNGSDFVGRSQQGVTYTTAQQADAIRTSNLMPNIYMLVSEFTGSAVPEPSGGLLVLFGAVLLALRRRCD